MTSLDLGAVILEHVFECTSGLKPAQIDKKYLEINDPAIPCPWVKIGNLYTSVTATGDKSWGPLIDNLYTTGMTNFAVCTGRHGLEMGTVVQELDKQNRGSTYKRLDARMPDPEHITQDIAQRTVVLGRHNQLRPITINLWNVGTTPDTTMSKTKRLACELLEQNTVVIFAWCYSLLSFYLVTESERASINSQQQITCYNTPIKDIANAKFGWALLQRLRNEKLAKQTHLNEYNAWKPNPL